MQWRAFMNLQLTTLEKDMQNSCTIKAAKEIGGYDTSNRKECLNSDYLIMKDLIQSIVSGKVAMITFYMYEPPGRFLHLSIIQYYCIQWWPSYELLRSNALNLWNLHFDPKIKATAFSISFKEAASLLAWFSKSGCTRNGVLNDYYPGCNREEVRALLWQTEE